MLPGVRFATWIWQIATTWRLPVGEFIKEWFANAADKFFRDREPEIITFTRDTLIKMKDTPGIPQEMLDMIDKSLETGDIASVVAGWVMTILGALPALMGLGAPLGRDWSYYQDRLLQTYRLDPLSVITAWRRDSDAYAKYLDDLKAQGWSDDRIEALKFVTEVYPTPRDYVGFLAHEVFEPDMVAKYGLMSDWDLIDKEPAKKIGLEEDILELYWKDHWQHPEWGTIQELRHRDQIDDQDVKDWFRLVEIPEYWRDKMLNVMWGLPNRIEIRMMARYLDLPKDQIVDLLKKAGLAADYRSDAADFMMIMGLTGYWSDMLSKGWMSPQEVRDDIDSRGFNPLTADRIYKRLVKAGQAAQVEVERDLTKADIYKGVKQGRISRAEGVILLMELGFNEETADYLLDINVPLGEEEQAVATRDLTKADIYNALKGTLITEAEARQRLLDLRYTPIDAELLLKIWKARITPPPEIPDREASKADIVLAVKKGLITQEQGYLMLQDVGFTPEASEFILWVQTETSPFSPTTFDEFQDLTGKWRRAAGMNTKSLPEALRDASQRVLELTNEIQVLQKALADEEAKFADIALVPEDLLAPVKELRVKVNRAKSALLEARQAYESQLAQFHQADVV